MIAEANSLDEIKEEEISTIITDSNLVSKSGKANATFDEIFNSLRFILNSKEKLISIFDLDDDLVNSDDVANKILQAFLESQKDNSFEIFKLALQWDRIDVVNKSDIFSGSDGLEPSQMEKLLEISLVENKPEFVRLLLDNGTNLTNFLTLGRFYYLYNSKQVVYIYKSSLIIPNRNFSKNVSN